MGAHSPGGHAEAITRNDQNRAFAAFFRGPIPPPNLLESYKAIDPTLPNRIMALTENQSNHRINIETKVIKRDINLSYLGWFSGTLLSTIVVSLGGYLIFIGRSLEGYSSVVGAALYFGAMFVYGKIKQTRELREHQERLMRPTE